MIKEKRDIIKKAIDKCKADCRKEGQEISDSRALEFVAISYLFTEHKKLPLWVAKMAIDFVTEYYSKDKKV